MATPGLWRTLRGWSVWLCGLLALGLVDRVLRLEGTGGLGEPATVLLSLGLAAVTIVLWWRGAASHANAARITLVLVQIGVGFVVYAFATLLYICGSGIDCM